MGHLTNMTSYIMCSCEIAQYTLRHAYESNRALGLKLREQITKNGRNLGVAGLTPLPHCKIFCKCSRSQQSFIVHKYLQKYGRKVQVQVAFFNPRDTSNQKLVCLQFSITFEIYMNSFPIHWFVNSCKNLAFYKP